MNSAQIQAIKGLLAANEELICSQNGFHLNWNPDPGTVAYTWQIPFLSHWWIAVTSTHLRLGQFVTTPIPLTGKVQKQWKRCAMTPQQMLSLPVTVGNSITRHSQYPLTAVSGASQTEVFGEFGFWDPQLNEVFRWEAVLSQLGQEHEKRGGIFLHLLNWTAESTVFHLFSMDEDFEKFLSALATAQSKIIDAKPSTMPDSNGSPDALERLAKLYADGLLSEEEFKAAKSRELGL